MGATKIVNVLKGDSLEELLDIVQSTPSEEVIFILPKKSKAFNSEDHFAQLSSVTEKEKKKVSFMMPDTAVAAIARDAGFEVLAGSGRTPSVSRKVAVAKTEPTATLAAKSLVVPDDEEQFDSGVYVSEDDATVGTSDEEPLEEDDKDEEEDIEKAGMHIDEGEEEDEVLPKEEDDLADEDEEKELDEDEEDINEELEDGEELGLDTADETSSKTEEPTATFARAGRNLEGFAKMPTKAERLKIPKIGGRELKVDVRNPQIPESNMEDIEEVWKNEAAEQKESLWKSLRPRKPSWWSRLMAPKQPSTEKPSVTRWSRGRGELKPTRRWILIGSAAIVAVVLLLLIFVPGNVRVIIRPASSPLNAQFKASISNEFASVDSTFNKLPGQLFELQETATKEFTATGEKQVAQKSKGTIIVSNTYGSAPQTLIATTRFESASGLIFRTLRTVTVPGTGVKNGEIIAGTVSVEVIADKAGAEYNIDPTTFKIPAFKERGDMERYGKFTASSAAPMTGGAVGLAKVVTDADFAKAKKETTEELDKKLRETLTKESSGLRTVSSASFSLDSLESTAQPDQAAEKFTITAKGSLRTMGFRDTDLEMLITEYAKKNYDVVVIPDQIKVDLNNPKFNGGSGALEVTVYVIGPGYMQIDSKEIAQNLGGKPEPDIRAYLQKVPGVDSAKVILSPFWIRKVPNNPDRIRVELEYKAE